MQANSPSNSARAAEGMAQTLAPEAESQVVKDVAETEDEAIVIGAEEDRGVGHFKDEIDPNSRLPHDPTNGGVSDRDQTDQDDNLATYHTRTINGESATLNRSRAFPGLPQTFKTWVVNKHGAWSQYKGHAILNWSDPAFVEHFNKWREAGLARSGWPLMRTDKRVTYSDEQRA
ncbi:hypothetical protein LTR62_008030 [Meristemomyces frigidus]|uniref:Uncharacterized protein n=1 Tax=Meristemomyces frigidus TaxID=1508187 RepID=A0AAN7TI55_9PEZI|nr:hypothetical protein LTR62_008030 [Meristemomyces frigidus]